MGSSIKSKRVGVLMGGPSSERDISIKSGTAVCRALENIGIKIAPIELAATATMNGYREKVIRKIRLSNIDVAFIALHGGFGEDGGIQEILEEINMPYTGSRVEASRLGMDKIRSRDIFKSKNIPVPSYAIINKTSLDRPSDALIYFKELGLPLVIKPSNQGSSIGLSIVDSDKDFYAGLKKALKYSDNAIVEEYVRGREITVGVLEDMALPIVEIIPKKKFFDFEAKYNKDLAEYRVPAEIDAKQYCKCQEVGVLAHKALGARYFSRIDMVLREDGIPVVLELNTVPGLTETSLLPKAAYAAGVTFEELILKILESAAW